MHKKSAVPIVAQVAATRINLQSRYLKIPLHQRDEEVGRKRKNEVKIDIVQILACLFTQHQNSSSP
jgi:hypothetical protein